MKYGLEIYAPVGPAGHFLDTVELFGGLRVFDANPKVEEALKERGRLWHREAFSHQYPHCWRCHNPVIFLATSQWFIRLDGSSRRIEATARADSGLEHARCARRRIDAIDHQVKWIPGVGPRPHLQHGREPARLVHLAPARLGRADSGGRLHERAARRSSRRRSSSRRRRSSRQYGADAWYERPTEEFIPDGLDLSRVRRHDVRAGDEHPRRLVRLRDRATRRCCRCGRS